MKFLQYITESINDKGIFKAIHMAGQSGAGKTFVLNKIKSESIEPRLVNTDTWTEFFKAYGSEGWKEHGPKIKTLTKAQFVNYIDSLLPLWVDGTSASPPSVYRRDGILKSLGYDTGMIWVNTSLETSIERISQRERKVPIDRITEMYKKIEALKPQYRSHFSFFVEIDNNDGELTDDVITKAFNRTSSFFTKKLENPIGIEIRDNIINTKSKYLTDLDKFNREYLAKLASIWYMK